MTAPENKQPLDKHDEILMLSFKAQAYVPDLLETKMVLPLRIKGCSSSRGMVVVN